jgi:acyl dehydratase
LRFEEFRVGQVLRAGPAQVELSDIVAFAKAYDPQWFHTDVERAPSSRWRGIIASGWHTCAIAMRLICEGPLRDSDSIGSPGLAYIKWPVPVRPGDALRLEAEVLEKRRSQKRRMGVLRWRWRLLNQQNLPVLDLEATSLFELNDPAAAASADP